MLVVKYVTADGVTRENQLLVSGWWAFARHFHYVPEIALSLAWTLPALFEHAIPYFYVVFLTGLLLHRSFRDEARCSAKYGDDWKKYTQRVPYHILPGIL
jgi:7-dehydrocholesterol reductase